MNLINMKHIIRLVVLFSIAVSAQVFISAAPAGDDDLRQPDLPSFCGDLQTPTGNKMSFRVYAIGVQVYRWNGVNWDFVAPVANLFADQYFRGKVGIHYAGPTWESNSGSRVVARRMAGCSPDPNAIPWLLLETVSSEGPGIFRRVNYIQRVNTVGGLPPATPGSAIGAEAKVPYTTEYYFYRSEN